MGRRPLLSFACALALVFTACGTRVSHRAVVAAAIVDALGSLDLHYPKLSPERLKELAKARRALPGKA